MFKSVIMAASAAILAGCAATGAGGSGDDANIADDPRLGAPADRICFPRNINGWRVIDGDDDGVILRVGVNDEYRVEYSGPCRAADFRFANAIGIENRPAGGCVRENDFLIVQAPGDIVNRCFITQINEWDEDAGAHEDDPEADVSEG
ncbi:MAG: DUF6491 family protein [Pseudomonadota bacterium]